MDLIEAIAEVSKAHVPNVDGLGDVPYCHECLTDWPCAINIIQQAAELYWSEAGK
jgi:hypothetical protein